MTLNERNTIPTTSEVNLKMYDYFLAAARIMINGGRPIFYNPEKTIISSRCRGIFNIAKSAYRDLPETTLLAHLQLAEATA